ncbi:hypothetical protein [Rhodospirillum sp. A1_3_36]|uniref:hypothetical protein n=1 Tax=Rhodospirillum sp. A1_3_36 TaxID=3391666 RepID=UPI0039A4F6FF
MLDYLIEREKKEMFRVSTRTLTFPGGREERVEAYRLVWSWWDRALACEFTYTEDAFLTMVERCATMEKLTLGQALGRVLDYVIMTGEADGLDYTDDNIALQVSKEATRRFYERKKSGGGGE